MTDIKAMRERHAARVRAYAKFSVPSGNEDEAHKDVGALLAALDEARAQLRVANDRYIEICEAAQLGCDTDRGFAPLEHAHAVEEAKKERRRLCSECPGMLDRLTDANELAAEALRGVVDLQLDLDEAEAQRLTIARVVAAMLPYDTHNWTEEIGDLAERIVKEADEHGT